MRLQRANTLGAPVVVVDFGTAVTFDVVDSKGNYVGGIIAPGLAAMTDYLHEKTALLPQIKIREVSNAIGKSTEHAMLIGAVHGYRGLIRGLAYRTEVRVENKKIISHCDGRFAKLIASKMPEITTIEPLLTWKVATDVGSSRPFVGERRKNSVRDEIVRIAAARFSVLGKFVMQRAGNAFVDLARQAKEQLMTREIQVPTARPKPHCLAHNLGAGKNVSCFADRFLRSSA